MNNDNQNNDLGLPKKEFRGISNEYDSILEKQQRIKDKENNTESIAKETNQTSNPRTLKEKRHKKIIIQTRIEEDDFLILKDHLLKKGYDTYSTGVRGIIKMYMRDNGLIE